MRIAVYGGSFNPPHVGHAMVASWLRWTDRADEVWLLPTFSHPFAKDMAPFEARVALCASLADLLGGTRVCTIEAELPEPSYTVDTLAELSRRHPGHTFRLVIGADVLLEVHAWKDWEGIRSRHDPIAVGRQGYPTPAGAVDFPGVSSTEIRARVLAGDSIEHLVPAALVDRIVEIWG